MVNIEDWRANRDQILSDTDWLVSRHKEQKELLAQFELSSTSITDTQYYELLKYRQDLRNSVNLEINPDNIIKPIWLCE
jgi:hypothetical protein